jgi:hypothetical protein
MNKSVFIDDRTPIILDNIVSMKEPNQTIIIYEGSFVLKKNATEHIVKNGRIYYQWFPSSGPYFEGCIEMDVMGFRSDPMNDFDIFIENVHFGKCFIQSSTIPFLNAPIEVKGPLSRTAVKGDRTVHVSSVKFSIPNLREFLGNPVRNTQQTKLSRSRVALVDEEYSFIIDKSYDYKEQQEQLNSLGGYIIQYSGELRKKNGSLSYDECTDVFHCFNTFISFLNGRRTSALFLHGIHNEETIWIDYTTYFVDPYKQSFSWPTHDSISGFNELWQKFRTLWKDEDDKMFLITAVHWYIEANTGRGFHEGSIIMAQTALELIYNWLLIENKRLLLGKDADNISAANKIRLLLSHINLIPAVPKRYAELQEFVSSSTDMEDGPDAITQIRNAIVHSQEDKRKKLSSLSFHIKYQALQLSIWYIELSILYILDFDDPYTNRCANSMFVANCKQFVPWSKKSVHPPLSTTF